MDLLGVLHPNRERSVAAFAASHPTSHGNRRRRRGYRPVDSLHIAGYRVRLQASTHGLLLGPSPQAPYQGGRTEPDGEQGDADRDEELEEEVSSPGALRGLS